MTLLDALKERAFEHQAIAPDRALRLWPGLDDQPTAEDDWRMGLKQPDWLIQAHNTRSGRIFMIGTGPSLDTQKDVLPRLAKEQTWTVNRAHRIDYLGFTPTHHGVAEPGPISPRGDLIYPDYDYPTALNRIAINWWPVVAPGWLWVAKAHDDIQMRWQGFYGLGDYLPPLPTGWASPLTSAQVAAWLGYTEFYFLGVDTTQGGQAWDVKAGTTRQQRSILSILECFDRARAQIEAAGRRIYDCTPGGRINKEGILEYRDLAEVLHA